MQRKRYFLGVVLGLLLSVAGAGPALAAEEQTIPYPPGYNLTAEGASAYQGSGNVAQSPYFSRLDVYHLQPTATLTVLPEYKTYQQTTEITCGPAAALTVLYHYNNTSWQELEIAKIMGTKPAVGTDVKGMTTFFKRIGWQVESSMDKDKPFSDVKSFKEFVIKQLKHNTPVMVENIDWGGHWRVVIGYDTMGTEATADDVLLMADSYDTSDHWQDGYVVVPVEKFFYMWFDAHMLPAAQQNQPWLVAKPPLQ